AAAAQKRRSNASYLPPYQRPSPQWSAACPPAARLPQAATPLHRRAMRSPRAASLDHLVGAGEKHGRHVEAKRLRCFEIDYHLVLSWCLHWQVGRFLALENAIDITGRKQKRVDKIRPVGDQSPASRHIIERIDCGQLVLRR